MDVDMKDLENPCHTCTRWNATLINPMYPPDNKVRCEVHPDGGPIPYRLKADPARFPLPWCYRGREREATGTDPRIEAFDRLAEAFHHEAVVCKEGIPEGRRVAMPDFTDGDRVATVALFRDLPEVVELLKRSGCTPRDLRRALAAAARFADAVETVMPSQTPEAGAPMEEV